MDRLSIVLMAVLGLVAGCLLGMGNFNGLAGAIIPGLVIGALVAGPFIRNRQWRIAGLVAVCGLIGCLSAVTFPDSNPVKRFCREQTNLVIHFNSFQFGTSAPEPK